MGKLKQIHSLELEQDAIDALGGMCRELCDAPNFANGRDVENWSKRVYKCVAERVAQDGDDQNVVAGNYTAKAIDMKNALNSLLESKKEVPAEGAPHMPLGHEDGSNAHNIARHAPVMYAPEFQSKIATRSVTRAATRTATSVELAPVEVSDEEEDADWISLAHTADEVREDGDAGVLDARDGGALGAQARAGPDNNGHVRMLFALQDVLDELGLNSERGVAELAAAHASSGVYVLMYVCMYLACMYVCMCVCVYACRASPYIVRYEPRSG